MDQRPKSKNYKTLRINHGGKLNHTEFGSHFLDDTENTGNKNENINWIVSE